jgi:hypothetical protein
VVILYVKREGFNFKTEFTNGKSELNKKALKAGLKQLLYVIGFTISVGFSACLRFVQFFKKTPFEASLAQAVLTPLQGFWNCFFFLYLQGYLGKLATEVRTGSFFSKSVTGKDSLDYAGNSSTQIVKSRKIESEEDEM